MRTDKRCLMLVGDDGEMVVCLQVIRRAGPGTRKKVWGRWGRHQVTQLSKIPWSTATFFY